MISLSYGSYCWFSIAAGAKGHQLWCWCRCNIIPIASMLKWWCWFQAPGFGWWLYLHECLLHTFLYMLYAYDYLSKSRIARTLTKYRSEGSNWWSLWVAWSENLTVCCENLISLVEMDRNRINGAFHGLLDYEMEYVSVMESKWLDVFFSHIYIIIYIYLLYKYIHIL